MKPGRNRWIFLPEQPAVESELSQSLKISPLLARILAQRGHDSTDKAERFLNPRLKDLSDPFLLGPLRETATRIWKAIDNKERIVIYGDYDVDGVTSTALLIRVLQVYGADVHPFLPRRMDEGYGLSADGMQRCMEETKPRLLIAVDCGTTATREITDLTKRGVDVIVLDHHQPPAELPPCLLINPKVSAQSSAPGTQTPVLNLATVGVVFKLCHGFLKVGRELGKPVEGSDLKKHLDLVAVGTVADVVPLDGENRTFVRAGLEELAKTEKIGLRTLMEVARVTSRLTPYHIGFQLGPRLNAMGRLSDAQASLELLLTADASRAKELAEVLDGQNQDRQVIEQDIFEEAMEMMEDFDPQQRVIVLANDDWHVGVIGIVAARVMREFYRPTVIIGMNGDGVGKGSCRSIEAFHIIDALKRCESLLERYGGHQAAAGLSIQGKNIDAFRAQLETIARETLTAEQLQPSIKVCTEVTLDDVNADLLDDLARLEPFGSGNSTPIFVARRLRLRSKPQVVGNGHLKLWLTNGNRALDAIGFNFGAWQPRGECVDIAFTPQWNDYQGERRIQLKLVDLKDSE